MSTLYRIDSSIQGDRSVTREMTELVEQGWSGVSPPADVRRRDLLTTAVSPEMWRRAIDAASAAEPTAEQRAAVALAAELAEEMISADAIVVGAPLYNWGPSAHVVCWIDLLWTDPRFAPRTYPLRGKPLALVVARGGGASPGAPQEGWDHSVPWLVHTFGPNVFGADVTLIETELTLADRSPAMAHLRDRAADLRAANRVLAGETGVALRRWEMTA